MPILSYPVQLTQPQQISQMPLVSHIHTKIKKDLPMLEVLRCTYVGTNLRVWYYTHEYT